MIRFRLRGCAPWCAAMLWTLLAARADAQVLHFADPPSRAERAGWAAYLELTPAQRQGLEAIARELGERDTALAARQDACAARWRAVLGDRASTAGALRSLLARRGSLRAERRALDQELLDRAALWLTDEQHARLDAVRRMRSRMRAAAMTGERAAHDVIGAVHGGGAAPNPPYDPVIRDAIGTWDREVTAHIERLAAAADALVEDLADRYAAGTDLGGAIETLRAAQADHAVRVDTAHERLWQAVRGHPDAVRVAAAWLHGGGAVSARDAAFLADPWIDRLPEEPADAEAHDAMHAALRAWIDDALRAMRSESIVAIDALRTIQERQRAWIVDTTDVATMQQVTREPGRWGPPVSAAAAGAVIVVGANAATTVPLVLDPRLPTPIRRADVARWAAWFGAEPELARDATTTLRGAVEDTLAAHDVDAARRAWFESGDRTAYDAVIESMRREIARAESAYFAALTDAWPHAPVDLWRAARSGAARRRAAITPIERLAALDVVALAVAIDAGALRDERVVAALRSWATGMSAREHGADSHRALRHIERVIDVCAESFGRAAVADAVVGAVWPELGEFEGAPGESDAERAAALAARSRVVMTLYDALRARAACAPDNAAQAAAADARVQRALRAARDLAAVRHTIGHGE